MEGDGREARVTHLFDDDQRVRERREDDGLAADVGLAEVEEVLDDRLHLASPIAKDLHPTDGLDDLRRDVVEVVLSSRRRLRLFASEAIVEVLLGHRDVAVFSLDLSLDVVLGYVLGRR